MRRLRSNRSGSTLVVFGLTAPVVLVAVLGVIGLSSIERDRSRLQDELDALVLEAARAFVDYSESNDKYIKKQIQLRIERKEEVIKSLNAVYAPLTIKHKVDFKEMVISAELSGPLVVQPLKFLNGERLNLKLNASALAHVDSKPICILALEDEGGTALEFAGEGRVKALDCVIWGNSNGPQSLRFNGGGSVLSERLCTVGRAGSPGRYKVVPGAEEKCARVRDPMVRWVPPEPEPCLPNDGSPMVDKPGEPLPMIPKGAYCHGLHVNARRVMFEPGVYTINGPLIIQGEKEVIGDNVGFHLSGPNARVEIDGSGKVNLNASKTGPMAGVIIAMDNKSPRAASSVMGRVDLKIGGIMYLPTQDVTYWGETDTRAASPLTTLIARTLKIGGDAYLEVKNNKDEATYAPVVETGQGWVRLL